MCFFSEELWTIFLSFTSSRLHCYHDASVTLHTGFVCLNALKLSFRSMSSDGAEFQIYVFKHAALKYASQFVATTTACLTPSLFLARVNVPDLLSPSVSSPDLFSSPPPLLLSLLLRFMFLCYSPSYLHQTEVHNQRCLSYAPPHPFRPAPPAPPLGSRYFCAPSPSMP